GQVGTRQEPGKGALGGDGAGGDGVHPDAAVAPLDREAASERLHAGFRYCRRDHVSAAGLRIGGGDVEYHAWAAGSEPAASTGHRHVQGAHEDDADYGLKGPQGEFFGAGEEVPGGVVHEDVERTIVPDDADEFFHGCGVANVAGTGMDFSAGALT